MGPFHLKVRVKPSEPLFGFTQHFGARVQTSNSRTWVHSDKLFQKSAMSFSKQKHPVCAAHFVQESCAAPLQFRPGEQPFQPSVMRRKPIKTHGNGAFARIGERMLDSTTRRRGDHLPGTRA